MKGTSGARAPERPDPSADRRHRQGPVQLRIVVSQSAFGLRRVEFTDLVAGISAVLQHLTTVRKTLRHIEGSHVVLTELDGDVTEESPALRTQVDDDVENGAASAPSVA
jgi:hypothetical protein